MIFKKFILGLMPWLTNQTFNLNAAYEKLKLLLDIWDSPGSG